MKPVSNQELAKKLLLSRVRVLSKYGFYGLMLMHMKLTIEDIDTAYTDSEKIAFGRDFLSSLDPQQVDFILMHEVMHVALKHVFRGKEYDQMLFNIACDIVVNSTIMTDLNGDFGNISIEGNVPIHLINGKEGVNYTAEEVYQMLLQKKNNLMKPKSLSNKDNQTLDKSISNTSSLKDEYNSFDNHSSWGKTSEEQEDIVNSMIIQVCDSIKAQNEARDTIYGNVPLQVERICDGLKDATVDWRELLANFLNFSANYDYTFNPIDRRYDGYDFFMPDYNVSSFEQNIINVIFLVDTSGSITDEQLTSAYSEINGALEQNIKMKAHLIFFDAKCSKMYDFDSLDSLLKIKPLGGGGTSLDDFFNRLDYFRKQINGKIDAIVCITDGEFIIPNEKRRENIPFIWLINNRFITPSWGIVARID